MSQPLSALLAGGAATPQPDRAHRLLVAQRLAEAVEAVHAAGNVIGNLDDQRVLVAPDGMVTLSGDPAATPDASASALAYTAPELQGGSPGRSRPVAQHDAFALAVLLFQLLMEGNHPYAGQWRGGGNLPEIPKAIQLGLYAYGGSAVTPPPGSPALSTLESGLAELFARSFAATSAIFRTRPTAAEWASALATSRQAEATAPPLPATDQPAPLPEPDPAPASPALSPTPMSDVTPTAKSQASLEATPEAPPIPALPAQEFWQPEPAAPSALAQRPQPRRSTPPVRRNVSRRAIPPRVVPPDDATSGESPHLFSAERPWHVIVGDHIGELRSFAQPDGSWFANWRDLRTAIETWRQIIAVLVVFLLFLVTLSFVGRDDNWANPDRRPVVQATRAPATQPPLPPTTVARVSAINPTVASFGSNFDVSDGVIPSTGERFRAYVRDRALRLEVFGRGARGKVMFNTAPAQEDFHFTVHVGETTGHGELLVYVYERKPDRDRTWVFAIDPGASTWGLYEELPSSTRLKTLIARHDFSHAIAREPVRTVTVTRKGERTSLLINGIAVNPQIARAMPRIEGPVTVGVGAMIPDEPDYADEPFVVTVERVAMLADEE